MKSKKEILEQAEADLLFHHDVRWVIDQKGNTAEDLYKDPKRAWEALRLVPPEDWYAEQIASYGKNGVRFDWREKTKEAWEYDKRLQERDRAGFPPTIAMARHHQDSYPFLGADGQPQRVRLATNLWVQPHSANPQIAPRHNDLGAAHFSEEAWAARWHFRVHPLDKGEFLGVLRQWVPRTGSKTPELWQELEEGKLKERWHLFITTYPLRKTMEYRQALEKAVSVGDDLRAEELHKQYENTVSSLGEQFVLDNILTISLRLAMSNLPADIKTANYAKMRICGLNYDDIDDALRAGYGGFAESAIIRNGDGETVFLHLPANMNWGHQANWYNRVGGKLTESSKWIEKNYGNLLFGFEEIARSDGAEGASIGKKLGRPKSQKYDGIPLTNENDFVASVLQRYRAGWAGWEKLSTEEDVRKAALLAFRRRNKST